MNTVNNTDGDQEGADARIQNESSTKSWWAQNWDKVVSVLLSLIVGGVAGFFSAILAIQDQIHTISTRVTTIETEANTSWRPNIDKIDNIEKMHDDLERVIKTMQLSDEAELLLRERLQSIVEDTRRRTANELREILKDNP